MGDGGRGDVATPGVLDGQRDSQGHAQVANLARGCQAADFRDFQIDHVHGLIVRAAHHHTDVVDHFIEDERTLVWRRTARHSS